MGGRCVINRDCKVGAIKKYLRTIGEEYTQYIGIAIDEPKRLARLKDNQISLLAKYGYTEQMAMELCRKYNLVSPIYETGTRGGCWFCPNAKISALANFRNKHPELWQELEILSQTENLCTTGFKWGLTLQEVNEKIEWRVYFKNGNCRDVCGWCVKQFQPGGNHADIVERIEKLTKKIISK